MESVNAAVSKQLQVGIVIVHCGGEVILEQCIRTLEEQTFQDFRVLVVDNGSEDGSVERVVVRHPEVEVIRLKENRGWSGGNNQGIRALLDSGTKWIWLLNNDTLVEPDCLERMMDYTNSHPAMKVLSPVLKYADPPDKVFFLGGKVDVRRVEVNVCESIEEFQGLGGEVWPYINGCAMLVHRDVFLKIGLIDERYFLYSEDVDFSVRAWRAGFGLAVVPDAELRHLVSYSTGGGDTMNPFRHYHFLLSAMLFWRKFLGMREFHCRACPVYLSKRLCGGGRELPAFEWDVYSDVLWALFTLHRGGRRRRINSPQWFRRLLQRKPWVVIALLGWDLRPLWQSLFKMRKT